MPRNRKQSGYIYPRAGWWVLRYRENVYKGDTLVRRQMAKQLAPIEPEHRRLKRPPPEIEQLAAEFLAPFNRKPNPGGTRSIRAFVEGYYLPEIKDQKRHSTYVVYSNVWKNHLAPRIGDMRLRDFTICDGQQLLRTIARERRDLSKPSLVGIKFTLSGIFKAAKRLGWVPDNPMRDVSLPAAKDHGRETGYYTLEEIKKMLTALTGVEPGRTFVAVAAFTGIRRGEIRGLEWQHYKGDALDIQQSLYLGHIDAPKSSASRALVPVIVPLKKILDEHQARCGSPKTGFVFLSRRGESLSDKNVERQIIPVFKAARIQWRGWHAFRRGLATNLHDLGVDDITIQRILRHSTVGVTQQCYIKTLPKQTTDAMKQFEERLGDVAGTVQ